MEEEKEDEGVRPDWEPDIADAEGGVCAVDF